MKLPLKTAEQVILNIRWLQLSGRAASPRRDSTPPRHVLKSTTTTTTAAAAASNFHSSSTSKSNMRQYGETEEHDGEESSYSDLREWTAESPSIERIQPIPCGDWPPRLVQPNEVEVFKPHVHILMA